MTKKTVQEKATVQPKTDTFKIVCPQCDLQSSVTVYSEGTGRTYGIDTAPLSIIAEVHKMSKLGIMQCIHCSMGLALQVVYAAKVRPLSCCYEEGWKEE